MENRLINISLALSFAVATYFVVLFLNNLSSLESIIYRILQVMGGTFPEGLIQFFTFWIFYFGLLEIQSVSRRVDKEVLAYTFSILPEKEQFILNPHEVNTIKLKVLQIERNQQSYYLTDLIKKACTKYRANKSTTEALEIVTNQVRINLSNAESSQSMIRYVAWAIPSVGFIGTIIGIAGSLANVKAEMSNQDIQEVTEALYVAFDTTLLSLFLSICLMFYFHMVQEKVEKFHAQMESYVLENLINRIYKA